MLLREDDHLLLSQTLNNADARRISAGSLLELYIVIDKRTDQASRDQLETYLDGLLTQIVPFTASQAAIARTAYQTYGKDSGHPAQLNFGDCISYALAKETGEPLLFKGDDFTHTDVDSAMP